MNKNPRIRRLLFAIQRARSIAEENGLPLDPHYLTNEENVVALQDKIDEGVELTLANIHSLYVLANRNPAVASVMVIFEVSSTNVGDTDVLERNLTLQSIARDMIR